MLNEAAPELLKEIWPGLSKSERTAARLVKALEDFEYLRYHSAVDALANRIYILHDRAALQAEFDRRLSPQGFSVGFGFDISDVDEKDEPWAAAWQLALSELELHPLPDTLEYDYDSVNVWVQEQKLRPRNIPIEQMRLL